MAIRVIESVDKALLDAFKTGLDFQPVEGRLIQQGKSGRKHWLIVEDRRDDDDNATYRLARRGIRFHASGVEILRRTT